MVVITKKKENVFLFFNVSSKMIPLCFFHPVCFNAQVTRLLANNKWRCSLSERRARFQEGVGRISVTGRWATFLPQCPDHPPCSPLYFLHSGRRYRVPEVKRKKKKCLLLTRSYCSAKLQITFFFCASHCILHLHLCRVAVTAGWSLWG